MDSSPLRVGRYHSLIVELEGSCAPDLTVTARSEEGEIMALAHREQQTYGVQFHPESILTQHGHLLLANFLRVGSRPRPSRTRPTWSAHAPGSRSAP